MLSSHDGDLVLCLVAELLELQIEGLLRTTLGLSQNDRDDSFQQALRAPLDKFTRNNAKTRMKVTCHKAHGGERLGKPLNLTQDSVGLHRPNQWNRLTFASESGSRLAVIEHLIDAVLPSLRMLTSINTHVSIADSEVE